MQQIIRNRDREAHITIDFSNFISKITLHTECHLLSIEYHTKGMASRWQIAF